MGAPSTFRLALTLLLAMLFAAGCAPPAPIATPPDEPLVWVPTQAEPPSGTDPPCPASVIEGQLVADQRWGLGLQELRGDVRMVIWPYGYAARRIGVSLELLDGSGSAVARQWDRVQIGGGETADGSWLACGGTTVMAGG